VRRVFFYVQHLLGIGHLRRAASVARALAANGFDVLLVSGGAPTADLALDGVRLHQLPPLRATDETLRELCRLDGLPLDDAFCAARTKMLLDLLCAEQPDVLLTEQFPFGRTRLRFELLPLLEVAGALRRRPLIVSSVRDVVRRTSARRVAEAVDIFRQSFDAILIHGDPDLVDFARSFAGWEDIKTRAHYTGYVAEQDVARSPQGAQGTDEIIVSVGGGAVGGPLLHAAIAARPKTPLADRVWRLLVGANLPAGERAVLAAQDGIVVEPARSDFTTLLHNATLSISQAGYNTVVETLCCAERAVLVPFASDRETEQADRAAVLAERGMVAVVRADTLSPDSLAEGVHRALGGPSIRSFPSCDIKGGAKSAAVLHRLLANA
jgi:predicted glycosyltransferase